MAELKSFSNDLMEVIDAVDAKGGQRLLDAKNATIDALRHQGFSDKQIEKLLSVKLT